MSKGSKQRAEGFAEPAPWQSGRVPNGFWDYAENRRRYMDWLGQRLGFREAADWYRVSRMDFCRNRGGSLLVMFYGDSPLAALQDYLPDYPWQPWLFKRVPQHFWREIENRRAYLDWLGKHLGFKTLTDWYQIAKSDFQKHNGGGLLANYYQDSPYMAMCEYRPDYRWKPWLFRSVPQHFWQDARNRRTYMKWLAAELKFKKPDDWYRVTKADFQQHGGAGLLSNYYHDSPFLAVRDYLPDHPWKPWLFARAPQGFWRDDRNVREYESWKRATFGGARGRARTLRATAKADTSN